MKAGTTVFWTQRDYAGNAVRVVKSSTVGEPFDIQLSQGGVVRCCRLLINRLARLDDLSESEMPIDRPKPVKKATTAKRERAPVQPKQTPPRVAPVSESSAVVSGKCAVLAIDFMNLLVRAWHAGAPTETHAVRSLFQTVGNAIRKLNPDHVVFAFDGGHKMRSELLPEYKANRPAKDPNLITQQALAETAIKISGFDSIRIDGWEADDVLASIAAAHPDTVIVSSDKDLLAMPCIAERCRVFEPWAEGKFVTSESKLDILAHHVTDYLAICGDKTDGIPGVKGIGEKTAPELLATFGDLESILKAAAAGRITGANGRRLKEQAEAARICRRVVELNHQLKLPAFESFSPVALWQVKLQDMRLGSVAAILLALQNFAFASYFADDRDPEPPESESQQESIESLRLRMLIDGEVFGGDRVMIEPERVTEPTMADLFGVPDVAPKNESPDPAGSSAFRAGVRCRGKEIANPFRRGLQEYTDWQAGFDS